MQDVARRRRPVPMNPADFPEWMRDLEGYEQLDAEVDTRSVSITYDGKRVTELPDAEVADLWQVHLVGPKELDGLEQVFDPLLLVAVLAGGVAKIDERIEELVAYCRSLGRSWTQIGQALGMSKQAAWERFSGED